MEPKVGITYKTGMDYHTLYGFSGPSAIPSKDQGRESRPTTLQSQGSLYGSRDGILASRNSVGGLIDANEKSPLTSPAMLLDQMVLSRPSDIRKKVNITEESRSGKTMHGREAGLRGSLQFDEDGFVDDLSDRGEEGSEDEDVEDEDDDGDDDDDDDDGKEDEQGGADDTDEGEGDDDHDGEMMDTNHGYVKASSKSISYVLYNSKSRPSFCKGDDGYDKSSVATTYPRKSYATHGMMTPTSSTSSPMSDIQGLRTDSVASPHKRKNELEDFDSDDEEIDSDNTEKGSQISRQAQQQQQHRRHQHHNPKYKHKHDHKHDDYSVNGPNGPNGPNNPNDQETTPVYPPSPPSTSMIKAKTTAAATKTKGNAHCDEKRIGKGIEYRHGLGKCFCHLEYALLHWTDWEPPLVPLNSHNAASSQLKYQKKHLLMAAAEYLRKYAELKVVCEQAEREREALRALCERWQRRCEELEGEVERLRTSRL